MMQVAPEKSSQPRGSFDVPDARPTIERDSAPEDERTDGNAHEAGDAHCHPECLKHSDPQGKLEERNLRLSVIPWMVEAISGKCL